MPAVVADCDALVLPSYREGVPRSLIEGFAAGRPAIATDVRGCRELVQDSVTGFLVPPRSPDLLAVALRRLVDLRPEHYRAMSAAAHALASDQYRESTVFRRLLNAYVEIGVPAQGSLSLGPAVVVDDLTPAHLAAGATTKEEPSRGSVDRVGSVNPTVQIAQPEQQSPHYPASVPRASQPSNKMVDAPEQLSPRAGRHPGVDFCKPSEEIPMTTGSEAGEVVSTSMDLLHEGRLGIHQATVGKNSMNLPDNLHRIEHVFENRLHDDCVDAACREWDRVRIGDQLGDLAAVKVQSNELDVISARVEAVQAIADGATAHDEDPTRPASQQIEHPQHVSLGNLVERPPDAS
jgi:hypothetical protein